MGTHSAKKAKNLIVAICEAVGVGGEDAQTVGDALISADLRGIKTHGIRCIPVYARRFMSGSLNSAPSMEVVTETATTATVNGDNGLGHVVGKKCMEMAIQKAKEHGVGIVCARNSNHYGAAAYFTMMAQKAGMIGLSCTNAMARIPPTGGKTPSYGNNPWSIAFPNVAGEVPLVIDMANSVVANSHIIIARAKGEKIPFGWAVDKDGAPTDDPYKATLLLPFGGYKGYAIAVAVEALAGVLSGAAVGKEVGSYDSLTEGQNVGHFFASIDVAPFMPVDAFRKRLQDFLGDVKSSELATGSTEIFVPGEKEFYAHKKGAVDGIAIDGIILEELEKLCVELELPVDL